MAIVPRGAQKARHIFLESRNRERGGDEEHLTYLPDLSSTSCSSSGRRGDELRFATREPTRINHIGNTQRQ